MASTSRIRCSTTSPSNFANNNGMNGIELNNSTWNTLAYNSANGAAGTSQTNGIVLRSGTITIT